MSMVAENPRAITGHNEPPEPTPFDQSREEIEGLYTEASHWLDGSGVKTQEDANAVSLLIELLRKSIKAADTRRIAEAKPHDEAKAEIQARYNTLIEDNKTSGRKGKATLALDVCKKALAPYLEAQDAEKRAKAAAARAEADAKAAAAQDAVRKTRMDDLEARAKAEFALQQAKTAEIAAKRAEGDKAFAKGGGRAVSLVTSYVAEVIDPQAWARHCWVHHTEELNAFLATVAQQQVSAGRHKLPGVKVTEVRTAR